MAFDPNNNFKFLKLLVLYEFILFALSFKCISIKTRIEIDEIQIIVPNRSFTQY